MVKAAVILSGCGHLDGAEIREAVFSLLYLEQSGAETQIFAPDIMQMNTVNHITGEPVEVNRNVLTEAARIARGKVSPLADAKASEFDLLVMPGGFGAAKNLSDFASKGAEANVLPELQALIRDFHAQQKPIVAICIAPAVLAAALRDKAPTVTIGSDAGVAGAIEALGGKHQNCATNECVTDERNRLVTTPAYMSDVPIVEVAQGIEKAVKQGLKLSQQAKKAA